MHEIMVHLLPKCYFTMHYLNDGRKIQHVESTVGLLDSRLDLFHLRTQETCFANLRTKPS